MEEKVEIHKQVEVVNDDLINFTDKDGKVTMNDMITMATVIQEEKIDEEIDKLKKEKVKLDKEKTALEKKASESFTKQWKEESKKKTDELEELLEKTFKDQNYAVKEAHVSSSSSLSNEEKEIKASIQFGKKKEKEHGSSTIPFSFTYQVNEEFSKMKVESKAIVERFEVINARLLELIDEKSNMAKTERKMKAKVTMSKIKDTAEGDRILKVIKSLSDSGSVLSIIDQSK